MKPSNKDIIRVKDDYYILATSALADDRTRVLKHDDTFAVFDRYGDIMPMGLGEQGLYHDGTRFLNRMQFRLGDKRPLFLSSIVKDDNSLLSVDLANPDVTQNGSVILPRDSIQIVRFKFLWKRTCYERIWIRNFALRKIQVAFSLYFEADFKDIFEIRGVERRAHGRYFKPRYDGGEILFAYRGLDNVTRRTRIRSTPSPTTIRPSEMRFVVNLKPKHDIDYYITVACENDDTALKKRFTYPVALKKSADNYRDLETSECKIYTSNHQFNRWLDRSLADLQMMVSRTPFGPYPYAGVPWFSAVFGRDGIITAMQFLWTNPLLARGVLKYLAANQADRIDPQKDAEPGKILHEIRKGEMAQLNEVPFDHYYGTVDATPLFVVLAGMYFERTADLDFVRTLWPNIRRALDWIDIYGDKDNDGFIEYHRQSSGGLTQQGWKDSHDSIFHEDGSDAEGPIALCEAQAYVYAAKLRAARIAGALRRDKEATELIDQSEDLRLAFEKAFWCEDLSMYALALDGKKRQCHVRTSNAGHCLFGEIANRRRALKMANVFFDDVFYSGWGIRTVASSELRYNPMSYHNGSIWPHDNAMIAFGMSRYGFKQYALKILNGLFDASAYVDLHRLPELFCGFARRKEAGPTIYPLACAPQSWAAGAVFMCLQACLGLTIDAAQSRIFFRRPILPDFLREIELRNLVVGTGSVDLVIQSHRQNVAFNVTRRRGDIAVVVVK